MSVVPPLKSLAHIAALKALNGMAPTLGARELEETGRSLSSWPVIDELVEELDFRLVAAMRPMGRDLTKDGLATDTVLRSAIRRAENFSREVKETNFEEQLDFGKLRSDRREERANRLVAASKAYPLYPLYSPSGRRTRWVRRIFGYAAQPPLPRRQLLFAERRERILPPTRFEDSSSDHDREETIENGQRDKRKEGKESSGRSGRSGSDYSNGGFESEDQEVAISRVATSVAEELMSELESENAVSDSRLNECPICQYFNDHDAEECQVCFSPLTKGTPGESGHSTPRSSPKFHLQENSGNLKDEGDCIALEAPTKSHPVFESSQAKFERNWDVFTCGLLDGLDWTGLVAAGGSVLACVLEAQVPAMHSSKSPLEVDYHERHGVRRWFDPTLYAANRRGTQRTYHDYNKKSSVVRSKAAKDTPYRSPFASSSDIDLFLVDDSASSVASSGNHSQAMDRIRHVFQIVSKNAEPHKVLVVKTDSAVTFVVGFPYRNVQCVLKKFHRAADVLTSFDLDCCSFAYDGSTVWGTARSLRAAATRCNVVDLQRRSMTYESRLLKYATRGFAIAIETSLYDPSRLDYAAFERADMMESGYRRRMRESGLGRLLLADRLSSRRLRIMDNDDRSEDPSDGTYYDWQSYWSRAKLHFPDEGPPVQLCMLWPLAHFGELPGDTGSEFNGRETVLGDTQHCIDEAEEVTRATRNMSEVLCKCHPPAICDHPIII